MPRDTIASVRVDLSEGLAWISKVEVVLSPLQVPVQPLNQFRDGRAALPMIGLPVRPLRSMGVTRFFTVDECLLIASPPVSGFIIFGRLATSNLRHEAESGSLVLRLAGSLPRFLPDRLLHLAPVPLHV